MDTKGTVALIDGDIVAYQVSSVNQADFDWGEGVTSQSTDFDQAWKQFKDAVEAARKKVKAEHVVMTLSCPKHNWRKDVLPTYKQFRKAVAKPVLLAQIKQAAAEEYKTYIRPSLEADDVLGILQTNKAAMPNPTVIVSIDKDLCTIPGKHYRPNDPKRGVFEVTEGEANHFFLTQVLTGDPTDGYKGCPGIGPKKAEQLFERFDGNIFPNQIEEAWEIIVEAYEKSKLCEEDALVQARVARICRSEDYNFKTKEVILWTP